MNAMQIRCGCGAVELTLTGVPVVQYCCHCDDCQSVHGEAYSCALYPAAAVAMTGDVRVFTLKTTPRTKCARCGNFVFAEVPGYPLRGVNGRLLPPGKFVPAFHVQCQFAAGPIGDVLPHFKHLPTQFGGSGELMAW